MLHFIRFSPELKEAICKEKYMFEICKQIPLNPGNNLEELYRYPGVFIFHGPNAEILSIHKATDSIGHHFQEHVDGYSRNSAPPKIPVGVSAIILDANSARFATEIKRILQDWLNPVYR